MFETYAALQKYGDQIKDLQCLSKLLKEKQLNNPNVKAKCLKKSNKYLIL